MTDSHRTHQSRSRESHRTRSRRRELPTAPPSLSLLHPLVSSPSCSPEITYSWLPLSFRPPFFSIALLRSHLITLRGWFWFRLCPLSAIPGAI
ncbi:hypothetical protein B296_00046513 [Ensete ventricosum]|uniref:Uncharacterized protein n=1 Tax=Ensete ventricosum TaxID=4639 RepID=A0A426YE10_ENSVE|nr:hypothetical protein B296_00046513 [Ensete ventricosum]